MELITEVIPKAQTNQVSSTIHNKTTQIIQPVKNFNYRDGCMTGDYPWTAHVGEARSKIAC